ncbi:GntR family transcriptional regulator [Cellulomonas soli]
MRGALAAEEQVMSTTQYATTFRINPATAAKAFAELVDEGVLYKRRGIGMFVAPGARDRLLSARRQTFLTEVVDPVLDQARVLGIDIEDVVAHLRAHTDTPTTAGDPS